MPKQPDPKTAVAAQFYAKKDAGPLLYIGAIAVDPNEDTDALKSRILSTTLGQWFDELTVTVDIPRP